MLYTTLSYNNFDDNNSTNNCHLWIKFTTTAKTIRVEKLMGLSPPALE